jgi:tetratricopeptide (TPR) repeat protein
MDLELTRVKLQHALGSILSVLGRFAEGNAHIEQAYAAARRDGRAQVGAFEAASLADNALALGDLAAALRHSQEALAEARSPAAGAAALARVLKTHGEVLTLAGDLGGALRALDEAVETSAIGTQRYAGLVQRARHWLHFELGRRDLALKGLRQLQAASELPAGERLLVDACLLHLGQALDGAALLDRLAALDNLSLRARALCLAEPACDAERVLPLLSLTAATARERGANGLWIDLQTHRISALRRLGREAEAREHARAVWQRLEAGACGGETLPRTARQLTLTWLGVDDELAQVIALRASAWMRRAAAGLPPMWRDNYLSRAPALTVGAAPAALGRAAP